MSPIRMWSRGVTRWWLMRAVSSLVCVLAACTGPDLIVGQLSTDAGNDEDAESPPCLSSAACGVDEPHCDLTSGRCVDCLSTEHCIGREHAICQPTTGECVECLVDTDCNDNRFCQLPEGECEDTP